MRQRNRHLLMVRSAAASLHVSNVILALPSSIPGTRQGRGTSAIHVSCYSLILPSLCSPPCSTCRRRTPSMASWRMRQFGRWSISTATLMRSLGKPMASHRTGFSLCLLWVQASSWCASLPSLIRVMGIGTKTSSSRESPRRRMYQVRRHRWSHGNYLPADDKHKSRQSLISVVNKMGKVLIKRGGFLQLKVDRHTVSKIQPPSTSRGEEKGSLSQEETNDLQWLLCPWHWQWLVIPDPYLSEKDAANHVAVLPGSQAQTGS